MTEHKLFCGWLDSAGPLSLQVSQPFAIRGHLGLEPSEGSVTHESGAWTGGTQTSASLYMESPYVHQFIVSKMVLMI